MPTIEALIEKMNNQPNGISFNEAKRVLENYGFILVRTSGSHNNFRNSKGEVITIKKEQPLKAVYVKDILERIGRRK